MSEEQLLAFLGGSLDGAARADVEAHLDACADCLELMTLAGKTSLAQAATGAPAGVLDGARDDDGADYRELVTVAPQHYVVGPEIARGGMGRILAARDRRLGRPVAIKELLTASSELRARFEREARITAKLQHPAIVSVFEAGTWPDGAPFYVMKLVTGESLDKAIAGRATLDARLELLPSFIAAVDALAYAHSMQVIHRDLKPGNVLVGEFGETVVIDWGFAKDLADTSGASEVAAGPYRTTPTGPGATLAGAIIGTPAYMPVEQARGEPVDERADVHALGAMLHHLLAGVPPYAGRSAALILDAVIAGPPPPIATRAPGVPRELVTIVDKAMARGAADRYPTAKELAVDLKKFQTGQLVGAHDYSHWQLVRRWIRRHRTPVTVAVAATLLLGVLAVVSLLRIIREQARADEQRQAAEQSRGEAEDLLSFMLVDLRDKVRPLGRLDLLDDVAQRAIAYYDRRGSDVSDAELAELALARTNLGDVLAAQGHTDDALRQHLRALGIRERLAAANPTDADVQHGLAVTHLKIGNAIYALGDVAGALVEYRVSLAVRARLAAEDPANVVRQRNLATGHTKVGEALFAQGDAVGALAEYRALLAIGERLATTESTTAGQGDLATAHERVGDVLFAQGDTEAALAEHEKSLAIRAQLVASDPTNAGWQRALSVAHSKIGEMALAQGDSSAALEAQRASLRIALALAANDPTSADARRELLVAHDSLSNVLLVRGDLAGGLAERRREARLRHRRARHSDRCRDG